MPVANLIYQGVEFTLVQGARGWAARIPRFGMTMYFASQQEAVDEAVRLLDAFVLPRVLRQARTAA